MALAILGMGSAVLGTVQEAYLKAFNSEASDYYGASVAIDGDTAVVGASGEDSAANSIDGDGADNSLENSGAAYIYVRENGLWRPKAYLKPNNPAAGAYFGSSVAISGDTVAITTSSNPDHAAVYIFVRTEYGWTQEARLTFATTGYAAFAESVALHDDTLVVGAPYENSIEANSGATIVFRRNESGWEQVALLKASNPGRSDRFGSSVDIWEDTVIVGAPSESSSDRGVDRNGCDDEAGDSGAAYIFDLLRDGSWQQRAYLKASNSDGSRDKRVGGDRFGTSVCIEDRIAVVGAPREDSDGSSGNLNDNSATNNGAAYIFERGRGGWRETHVLKSGPFYGGYFGVSVDIYGPTIGIGASFNRARGSGIDGNELPLPEAGIGAVYIFKRLENGWNRTNFLRSSTPVNSPRFGEDLAISESLLITGSLFEKSNTKEINGDETDSSAPYSGAAYIFDLETDPSGPVLALSDPGVPSTQRISLLDLGTFIGEGLVEKELEIANVGDAPLDLFCVTTEAPAICSGSFIGSFRLNPGDTIPLILRFSPDSSGEEITTYNIVSNDPRSPFDFDLKVTSLFQTVDQDSDGMNDAAEYLLRDLGFDWNQSQTDLVTLLNDNAEIAGLCSPPAAGLVQLGTPVLTRDSTTGMLTLEIGCQHSQDLSTFVDMPLHEQNVLVNAEGNLELQMNPVGASDFFHLQFE